MKLKRTFSIICILVVISIQLSGCTTSKTPQSDYDSYPTTEKLVKASDVIVSSEVIKGGQVKKIDTGTNKNRDKQQIASDTVTYTVSQFKVDEVIKGNLKIGDIINVKQLGDKSGDVDKLIVENGGYYKKGSSLVLFLASFEDISPGTPYSVLNPIQGQVEFVNNEIKVNKKANLLKGEANKSKSKFIAEITEIAKNQR